MNLLIDGPFLSHKAYSAPYKLTTSMGLNSTMLHSFIRSLNVLRKQFNPAQIIIAWESPGTPSFRRLIYPQYKPSCIPDQSYISQLKDLQKLLYLLKVEQYSSSSYEADDVIATLSKSGDNIIFTADKDIMQLVSDTCKVYDGKTLYDKSKVKEKFGVSPEYIPDLLAIWGDKADNIEGLLGYGIKKASKLVNDYGSIYKMNFWSEHEMNKILLNRRLTVLKDDCKLEVIPKEDVTETIDEILNKYELRGIQTKIEEYKSLGGKK